MSTQLAYRMRVYAGIYGDDTDTTVLTPATSAPHSGSFQVATLQGLAGYQPYMNPPKGKRGSIQVPEQKLEVGNYTVELLDKRTGTDNINRWVTAFFGDDAGKFSLIGKKAYIEESVDNGSTWSPFFVGQIASVDLNSPTKVTMNIKDNVEFLKEPMFRSHPRTNYTIYKSLVPAGIMQDVVNDENEIVLEQTEGLEVSRIDLETYFGGLLETKSAFLDISTKSRQDKRNIWTYDVSFYTGNTGDTFFGFFGNFPVRARVEVNGTPYHFGVYRVFTPFDSKATNNQTRVHRLELWPLAPWEDALATDADTLPTGNVTGVRVWLYKYEPTSESNNFWLNAEWDEILADMLDGKFHDPVQVTGGLVTVARKTAYDAANLLAVRNARVIPRPIFRVGKSVSAVEWLEKSMLSPYSVGYAMEPVEIAGVPLCKLRVYSTAQPTSLSGLVTINGDDVQAKFPEWNIEQPVNVVVGTYYEEYETRVTNDSSEGAREQPEPFLEVKHSTADVNTINGQVVVNTDVKKIAVDMNGVRAFIPLNSQQNNYFGVEPNVYTKSRAARLTTDIFNRFRGGISTVVMRTLRNSKTNGVSVGDFVLVEVEVLPNQATHTRAGTRLMQVVNKYAVGMLWEMELLDSGVNTAMLAPTVGTPTSPNRAEVEVDITTAQRAMIQVEYAATEVGATQPNSDSQLWTYAQQSIIDATTESIVISGLPEGRKIWIRARAVSPVDEQLRLNSQWVVGGSVTLANIATPSGVSVDRITLRSARVSWTNTDTTLPIEVWLASPAATPDTRITTLPAGSTTYILRGLDRNTSTSHRVGIRYLDQYQGNGAFATADFTASGDPPVLDAPAAILLYVSK